MIRRRSVGIKAASRHCMKSVERPPISVQLAVYQSALRLLRAAGIEKPEQYLISPAETYIKLIRSGFD